MLQFTLLLICLSGYCLAGPVGLKRNMPIVQRRNDAAPLAEIETAVNEDPNEMMIMSTLSLPSNATSIRADITDGFSCLNKTYGYYADVDNDCQIFHVCMPVTYADGKENTFRWSFICPEETIFSQDSFTCMRPDDMTISCEESYQYYELNRNFGIIDSTAEKENNNNEVAENNDTDDNENFLEAEAEPAAVKPVVQKEIEKEKGATPPKPIRRKPSHSFAIQKKPTNSYPLRKIPQVFESPAIQLAEDVNASSKPVEENLNKPAVQKFSRRPIAAVSNSFKDKIQNSKTENVMATRTDLFNQIRKRPTMFNRKPAEQAGEEEKPEEHVKIETKIEQQNFSPMESIVPLSNTETEEADADVQASESNHIFVKAEDSTQNKENSNKIPEESVKVLEAFEEIPAVISEVVDSPNAEEEETTKEIKKSQGAEEPQIKEETQSAEEVPAGGETPYLKDIQTDQETEEIKTAEEMETNEEKINIEEVPAKEETPEDQNNLRTSAEEIQNIDDPKVAEEVVQETQADEEADKDFKIVENLKISDEIQNVPEAQQIEKESQVAEKENEAVEPQIVDEMKNAEESQISMEDQIAEGTLVGDETKTVKETHAFAEEIPEAPQNLRTSAEVINNNENAPLAGKLPTINPHITDEIPALQQTESVDESKTVEMAQAPEEEQEKEEVQTVEEIQETEDKKHMTAVQTQEVKVATVAEDALLVDEPQPVVRNVEQSQVLEEAEENSESIQSHDTNDSGLVKSDGIAEPTIFEENSKEGFNVVPAHTIEKMESENPMEVPETMHITEEVSQPDAVMQQMYENTDMNKQSAGGFKPVDPVMAQEAEQLIVDFINTLRNNDFTNETPGMLVEQHNDEAAEEVAAPIDVAETQEAEKLENGEREEEGKNIEEKPEHQNEAQAEMTETHVDTVEETQNIPEVDELQKEHDPLNEEHKINYESDNIKSLDPQSSENIKEFEKFREAVAEAESMNLPQEMYQIPVKVITIPDKEMPENEEQLQESERKSTEITDNNEQTEKEKEEEVEKKVEEESLTLTKDGNKPLSIDDIVELVKERLDNMPKTEMAKPMQLENVLGEAQEHKETEENMDEQITLQMEEKQHIKPSEEEIIMPIYQRIVQIPQLDAAVQNEESQETPNEEQLENSNVATDTKEKTNRSYKSRSMLTPKLDSRKRHFLFKTDSS